jgi:hypothetical protein
MLKNFMKNDGSASRGDRKSVVARLVRYRTFSDIHESDGIASKERLRVRSRYTCPLPYIGAIDIAPRSVLTDLRVSARQRLDDHASGLAGSGLHIVISRIARRPLALRPAHSRCHQNVTCSTEGFSRIFTSITAPVACGPELWPSGLWTPCKAPPSHGARS